MSGLFLPVPLNGLGKGTVRPVLWNVFLNFYLLKFACTSVVGSVGGS